MRQKKKFKNDKEKQEIKKIVQKKNGGRIKSTQTYTKIKF